MKKIFFTAMSLCFLLSGLVMAEEEWPGRDHYRGPSCRATEILPVAGFHVTGNLSKKISEWKPEAAPFLVETTLSCSDGSYYEAYIAFAGASSFGLSLDFEYLSFSHFEFPFEIFGEPFKIYFVSFVKGIGGTLAGGSNAHGARMNMLSIAAGLRAGLGALEFIVIPR